MIIEDIFCSLSDLLMDTDLFMKSYEYVELVQPNKVDGSVKLIPRYYEGGGYKDVQNFDVGGMFYLRKNGKTSVTQDTKTMQPTPCNDGRGIVLTLPIRCVSAVLREKFGGGRFADELLASSISDKLQGSLSASQLNAKSVNVQITLIDTDSYNIFRTENQGVEFKEATLLKFAYVAVDFTVTVNADMSCLSSCQNQY